MRFAHVSLALGSLAGVDGAIRGVAAAARRAELPLDVIILAPEGRDEADVRVVQYPRWRRFEHKQRLFRYRAIADAPLEDYDVVFLRYPMSLDLDPDALFRRRPGRRIVTIHHTKEIAELASGRRSAGIAARMLLEWVSGRRVLSRVDGIVGVTDEIRRYELARSGRAKPSAAISNGIDVEQVPFTRFTPFGGKTLHLVVVASSVAPWHGWDRLEVALRRYRGAARIVVDAVGGFGRPAGTTEHGPDSEVRYHGLLKGAALSAVLENANLAMSSLALHRAGLREGCVLKTREYVARGLPFVYAYDDVDLRPDDPFCLRLPSGNGPVALDDLLQFASQLPKDVSERSRAVAQERMDWTTKARALTEFGRMLTVENAVPSS